jgi:hypothetical protein
MCSVKVEHHSNLALKHQTHVKKYISSKRSSFFLQSLLVKSREKSFIGGPGNLHLALLLTSSYLAFYNGFIFPEADATNFLLPVLFWKNKLECLSLLSSLSRLI